MARLRGWMVGCILLGAVSLLLTLPAHLALADIRRGENDLGAEWRMVQVAAAAIAVFQIAALATFARLLRALRRN